MSARITLEVIKGKRKGNKYVFDERTTCIMGRAKDCNPKITDPKGKPLVSRHHCLLDINPPDIRIRDFGSLNGTFVNKTKIGQRDPSEPAGGASWTGNREYDLKDGDRIRIGNTILQVQVSSAIAHEAQSDAPDESRQTRVEKPPASFPPTAKEGPAAALASTESYKPRGKRCTQCGRDVSDEVRHDRKGEYVCAACRSNPSALVKLLFQQASTGDRDLVAISGYELIKTLGHGGMGAVYLARQQASGENVALKVMLPKVAAEERAIDIFLRETLNTKALEHANVVRLYDSGCSHGTFFFTLEFCDGGSVLDLMKRRGGKLSIDEAGRIILQALDGLAYAHSAVVPHVRLRDGNIAQGRGLVHRDLKPHNVFLSGRDNALMAKLGDYGLSKAFDLAGLSGHTYTGDVAGTPHYMPRQQVLNFRDAGPEVDVWALAATLYSMLTSRVPRRFTKDKDPWQIILQTGPVPIRKREPSIPRRLADVIDHALLDNPEIGFKTAAELRQALAGAL